MVENVCADDLRQLIISMANCMARTTLDMRPGLGMPPFSEEEYESYHAYLSKDYYRLGLRTYLAMNPNSAAVKVLMAELVQETAA